MDTRLLLLLTPPILPFAPSGLDRIPFQKMLVVRSLRPDRMTNSLNSFIRGALPNGNAYADCDSTLSAIEVLDQSLGDSTPSTPIYFILSPGANVVGILDKLADKYKYVAPKDTEEWRSRNRISRRREVASDHFRDSLCVHARIF